MAAEVVFVGENPTRVIKIGLGDSTRSFRPMYMNASVQREPGYGVNETETLVAMFDAAGNVTEGNRQYFTTDNTGRERRGLMSDDHSPAKELAMVVVQRCLPKE